VLPPCDDNRLRVLLTISIDGCAGNVQQGNVLDVNACLSIVRCCYTSVQCKTASSVCTGGGNDCQQTTYLRPSELASSVTRIGQHETSLVLDRYRLRTWVDVHRRALSYIGKTQYRLIVTYLSASGGINVIIYAVGYCVVGDARSPTWHVLGSRAS
jgi:hypothetical protein